MNNTQLIGRLTKDPEISYSSGSQTAIAKIMLAIDRPKKNGQDQGADYIRCVAFGKAAEAIEKWVHKGDRFGVTGRIQTGSYDHRDGYKVYTTDVIIQSMDFLESKRKDDRSAAESSTDGYAASAQGNIEDNYQQLEGDLPF